jgi:hypothetical protein
MTFARQKACSTVRESYIERKVCEYAIRNKWITFKWTSPSSRFVPDRLFFRNGKVLIIEFKAPGAVPNKGQRLVHKILDKAGFKVHIVDDVQGGKNLLDKI